MGLFRGSRFRLALATAGAASIIAGSMADFFSIRGAEEGLGTAQIGLIVTGAALLLAAAALRGATPTVPSPSPVVRFEAITRAYRTAAILVTNTLILFAAANLIAALVLRVIAPPDSTAPARRVEGIDIPLARLASELAWRSEGVSAAQDISPERLQVYPGWSAEDLRALLDETYAITMTYEALTQFAPIATEGQFVNISENGYRMAPDQGGWPMDPDAFNVWVFGGSTTFGWALADDESIPVRIQQHLRQNCGESVQVYNFARPYYFSSQEIALYKLLLESSIAPDLVIMVDGVNEPQSIPAATDYLSAVMEDPSTAPTTITKVSLMDGEQSARRWLFNRAIAAAISEAFAIPTLFVWQPCSCWNYDLQYQLFSEPWKLTDPNGPYGTINALRHTDPALQSDNFLWLGDIQEDVTEPLYVDPIHYTAAFSDTISQHIVDHLTEQMQVCPAD
jgi:hypothetical protein